MIKDKKHISKADVQYIATLSRIHLKDEEIERLTKNLEDILGYVEKLEKLDVGSVNPTSHVLALQNVYREDQVRPSLKQEQVMDIAVEKQNGFFKVPQVI